jgi:hypothetical protein
MGWSWARRDPVLTVDQVAEVALAESTSSPVAVTTLADDTAYVFAFEAAFYGSRGSVRLNRPVSGIVGGTAGYLMVGQDGGIFAFGDVPFHGSLGDAPPPSPIVAVALKQ